MIVTLPDPPDGHGCSQKTIGNSKNGEDNNKDNYKSKACLHGGREAVKYAPPIAAVSAAC
jgi:hypothetical protein